MTAYPSTAIRETRAGVAHDLAALARTAFPAGLPVRLRAWDGSEVGPAGDATTADAPTVVVRSPKALRRLLWSPGELGLAQAYVSGELDVEGDLLDGFRRVWRCVREQRAGAASRQGWRERASALSGAVSNARRWGLLRPPPAPPASQARLRGRLHTLRRDRDAIAHHYDLSNDFYRLILDRHLAYSCAYFGPDPNQSLEDAQRTKLDLICRKLGLDRAEPGHRHLDVGCGWGALSLHAAAEYGVQVLAITLSGEQRDVVRARVAEAGLEQRVEVRLQDYRALDPARDGTFHTASSIEMGEHVGESNYPRFAALLRDLLRPRGRLLLQQMSRSTQPGGGPFIEAFIAPDMHMRPVGETVGLLEEAGLEVRDVHALREHYVRTVHAWYAAFEASWDRAVDMVGEEMARVWRLYLVGGALAFEEGRMGVDQLLAVRPDGDGGSGMPVGRPA
jgi:cyclopropane-fatty-acyl-phospholipid synthase